MWKAIPDMSDEELSEARQQVGDRLRRGVAGHGKAHRLETRRRLLDAEAERREGKGETEGGPLKVGDRVESRGRDARGTVTVEEHGAQRPLLTTNDRVCRVLWDGPEETEYDVPVMALRRVEAV